MRGIFSRTKNLTLYCLNVIKSLFIKGLLTILPITLTIALFTFTFNLIKNWLQPIHSIMPKHLQQIQHSEIALVLVFILFIGIVLKLFLLQPLIDWIESIFRRIPLVRHVYFGIKQLVHAFHPHDEESFQDVALIEFPRKGIYSIGFITGTTASRIFTVSDAQLYNVFIPNTPNPTTGYYIIAREDECQRIPLTRQEAMTIVISGGIITPERFTQK